MDKQRVLSHIMASPVSIDIISNLSGAVSGLPFQILMNEEQQIQQHLSEEEIRSRLASNLIELLNQEIIAQQGENYSLTKDGIDLSKTIKEIASGLRKRAETSRA
jgi:predicted transcriptional regulator